jgi:chromosome segregation ATPase
MAAGSSAATELAVLAATRAELDERADALDREQRQASENVARLSAALADLERRAAAGEQISDEARTKAERELTQARITAGEPWAERRDGVRAAIRDADHATRTFVAEHLDELLADLVDEAEAAATAVDRACHALITAYRERQAAESRVTELCAMVRPPRPGDIVRTRSEALAREAERLLAQGGEAAPVPAVDPRQPRHGTTRPIAEVA